MYRGATKEAVPTEMPSRNRNPISIAMFTAKAQPSAPTTYTEPDSTLVHLRLIASAR